MSYRITSTAGALLDLVQRVSGVVGRKSPVPVLNNILLKSEGSGTLHATGSDMEVEVSACDMVGEIEGNLHLTVDGRKLLDILKSLKADDKVSLSGKDDGDTQVLLRGNGFKFKLATLPASDFPRIEALMDQPQRVQVDTLVLAQALHKVSHAQGIKDVRYYLNGTLLDFRAQSIEVVATDGHRLAKASVPLSKPQSQRSCCILTRKGAAEIQRLLASSPGECTLDVSATMLRVSCADTQIIAKLIEGKFPDYDRVIPSQPHKSSIKLPTDRLRELTARVSIVTGPDFAGIRIAAKHGREDKAVFEMESTNAVQEIASVSCLVDLEGVDMAMGLNAKYLSDVLGSFSGDELHLGNDGPQGVLVLRDPQDPNFTALIMPLRL